MFKIYKSLVRWSVACVSRVRKGRERGFRARRKRGGRASSPLPFFLAGAVSRPNSLPLPRLDDRCLTCPAQGRICCDPWLEFQFSVLMRQLFEEYNNMVSTVNVEEFCRTVLGWLEQHCSLPALRPGEFINDFVTNSHGALWDSFCANSWVRVKNKERIGKWKCLRLCVTSQLIWRRTPNLFTTVYWN